MGFLFVASLFFAFLASRTSPGLGPSRWGWGLGTCTEGVAAGTRRGDVPTLLAGEAEGQVDPAAVVSLSRLKVEHQLGSQPSVGYI